MSEEQIFSPSIQNDKQVDLQGDYNPEIEVVLKDRVMKAREVFLEQERVLSVLRKKFEYLQAPENLDQYCEQLGVGEGVREDLRVALPDIIAVFTQPTELFFAREILPEEYELGLYDYLKSVIHEQTDDTYQGLIEQIVSAEVDLAVIMLDNNRCRPVLSHRGRGYGFEASHGAFQKALEEECPEIEFDIRISSDGVPIIHHNATLGASIGRPEAVKNFTAAELTAMKMKNGDRMVTLEEFFEMTDASGNKTTKINIDIKDFNREMLDNILDLIKKHNAEHRVAIVSWFPQALQYMYEKDPTLCFHLSYFPGIRGISRMVAEKISQLPSGALLTGKVGTMVAKFREMTLKHGLPYLEGAGVEQIRSAMVLDADQHWSELLNEQEEDSLSGRHTISYTTTQPIPTAEGETSIMARVLRNGGISVMAFEEMFSDYIDRIPILRKFKKPILNLFSRRTKLIEFAQKCAENGIKINIYDLIRDGDIANFFEDFEQADLQSGVVYTSGGMSDRNLDTRGMVPTLDT